MRRCLIAASLAFTVGITHAQIKTGPLDFLIPGPVSMIMSAGKWLLDAKTKQRVYVITVQCQDSTEERSRARCFKLAVEQSIGSLMLSETHVRDNVRLRQDIIEYSSGYIDRYTILDKQTDDGAIKLVMEVTVAESKIADRVLNSTKTTEAIDGDRLSTITNSFLAQQRQGSRVVGTVAKDFTAQAFDIKISGIQLVQDYNRGVTMQVTYDMSWNWKYFQSINEALKTIAEPVTNAERAAREGYEIVSWMKAPDAWIAGTRHTHRFRDPVVFTILTHHMVDTKPLINLEILDSNNVVVHRQCWKMSPELFQFQPEQNLLLINGNATDHRILEIKAIDPAKLPRYQRATIKITPYRECRAA